MAINIVLILLLYELDNLLRYCAMNLLNRIWRTSSQQDLLKKVVEIKPKRPRVSSLSDGNRSASSHSASTDLKSETKNKENEQPLAKSDNTEGQIKVENPVKSVLGLAYASSDDED
ncbi:hypothetical protein L484_006205 [Morus notabilis]|uniref:Uncharacterized protein n=1 Tax=Morus notabilis TaxID=981085 RepID=W9QBQ3_9ROSA|nr:hypothetical protein L484_006205 [Morus notabilis]